MPVSINSMSAARHRLPAVYPLRAWVRGGRRLPSHVKENVMRAVLMLVITWMVLSPEIVTTSRPRPRGPTG